MKKNIIFMFSGQGSQYYNMGIDLYKNNQVFYRWMNKLDAIFYNIVGESLIKILYDSGYKKGETFNCTLYTHPAIFMIEYSLAQVLIERGIHPDYVLGSSIGEFASCAIADVMNYEDIILCLAKQAQILEATCKKGGMLAIIHDYKLYNDVPILYKNSELVGINYDSHFVVSGNIEGLLEIEKYLKLNRILSQKIPVSFAFHSSLMDPAASVYSEFLKSKTYRTPNVNVISCLTGNKVTTFYNDYLWDVVRNYIEFPNAIKYLEKDTSGIYIDLSPSGTLANFTKRNLVNERQEEVFSIITPFGKALKNLEVVSEHIFS